VTVQLTVPADLADDWDLDVSIVESGPEADRLIRMTDDNCTSSCQSACPASCP
jgi:FxLD family lantipeptide